MTLKDQYKKWSRKGNDTTFKSRTKTKTGKDMTFKEDNAT